MDDAVEYRLYYWPTIPGRAELARLVLAEARAAYVDVARLPESEGGGFAAERAALSRDDMGTALFAPPLLQHGDLWLSQSTNIALYLARRHALVPDSAAVQHTANQLALTLADLSDEAHDTHHPIAVGQYYEDQKPEALRRASDFVNARLPKFLAHFERCIALSGGPWLLGAPYSYVDLFAFQVMEGLRFAFPQAMQAYQGRIPGLSRIAQTVPTHKHVAAYLNSGARLPFSDGVFRHYPELDLQPSG